MKDKTYNFHSDSSHGYLEVDVKELQELGIYDEITCFSYYKDGKAYLEEDHDAYIFINAWKKKNHVKDFYEIHDMINHIEHGTFAPCTHYSNFLPQ